MAAPPHHHHPNRDVPSPPQPTTTPPPTPPATASPRPLPSSPPTPHRSTTEHTADTDLGRRRPAPSPSHSTADHCPPPNAPLPPPYSASFLPRAGLVTGAPTKAASSMSSAPSNGASVPSREQLCLLYFLVPKRAFDRDQVVGWPPRGSYRKNTLAANATKTKVENKGKSKA
ncbi:unnamed protein product [Triticum turgidum subsp. durum]|uniref:Auxin-responsive protein n=1 Tax=Triticum turgidum subsp. durum TaxID=4567 RepID=A0A9R0XTN3_TRITD|nr:unnamed protein product [Triticum turgidum subsp. durum]